MAMSGFFTLLAENVIVILGFAIYGILVYYMVAKTIRRNSGKKPRGSSGKKMGLFTMFRNNPREPEDEEHSRKDFSRDLPTANSYRHRKSQQD